MINRHQFINDHFWTLLFDGALVIFILFSREMNIDKRMKNQYIICTSSAS